MPTQIATTNLQGGKPPRPDASLIESLLAEEVFLPPEPASIEETGISPVLIESLTLKYLLQVGSGSGREIAQTLCLPLRILEDLLQNLRRRQLLVHQGQTQFSDYRYALTEAGVERARVAMASSAYVGAAPVLLEDYVLSVEAQTIRAEAIRRHHLQSAFGDIRVEASMVAQLGPAINSGAGLFLYGSAGNGKTTLAKRITKCFGQPIWIPRTLCEDGQFVKLFDPAFHEPVGAGQSNVLRDETYDHRWVKIRRPTVVVGGELVLDSLEIRHDASTNVSEAPLQLKSNCGCLLIDDFGRQRVEPQQLLNRWIVPLESRVDYLALSTGKKIQVPFDQLIIFSTNLEPTDLADEAFLRRIPYKIELPDPSFDEYSRLFEMYCREVGCRFDARAVDYLMEKHYRPANRPLRRCQPRDLLYQAKNYCAFHDLPVELRPEVLDHVAKSYFTAVSGQ